MAKYRKNTILSQWQERAKEGAKCENCGRTENTTVDHIVPISILESLNLINEIWNWWDNFQMLCRACNSHKGEKIDIANPKTYRLLEEAIKKSKEQITEK